MDYIRWRVYLYIQMTLVDAKYFYLHRHLSLVFEHAHHHV